LEFPVNAAAAAISREVAPAGSAAACWITGLNCSRAGSPGNPAAGNGSAGMAGSAIATPPAAPKTSTADELAATAALAAVARVAVNSVWRRDMISPIVGGVVYEN
jgi:hypothetical protein